ncbi:MAG: hypothetical protein CM1200mP12_21750 [Gammaproteobacteria bacterium]|nr:MAG: hypothetical protein CM1200mP12_21750 [Gammaproteobacteria bacterium]
MTKDMGLDPQKTIRIVSEDFFSQDITYRLSLIAESKSLPVGISEVPEEEPLDNYITY